MEKFDYKRGVKFVKKYPFSYFSLPVYLDFRTYVIERSGEKIVVWQDLLYPHDFPAVFLPHKKSNWPRSTVACCTDEDIKKINKEKVEIKLQIPVEAEYFYLTSDFVNPQQRIAKEIRRFHRNNKFKLLKIYSKEKIKDFYIKWKKQKNRSQSKFVDTESDSLFYFTLDNLRKYKVKELYVEINKKLVGLVWACKHPGGGWASLHLKTDYSYSGMAHFLRHTMALEFSEEKMFTTGTGCSDEGIRKYKKHLKPVKVINYHYLFLGDKR